MKGTPTFGSTSSFAGEFDHSSFDKDKSQGSDLQVPEDEEQIADVWPNDISFIRADESNNINLMDDDMDKSESFDIGGLDSPTTPSSRSTSVPLRNSSSRRSLLINTTMAEEMTEKRMTCSAWATQEIDNVQSSALSVKCASNCTKIMKEIKTLNAEAAAEAEVEADAEKKGLEVSS